MDRYRLIGKKVIREDGPDKVRGALKYMGDLKMEGMLHGAVLRSAHHHALLRGINIAAALAAPGVVEVLTAADVPGQNGFGIAGDDQPVFAEEKVRYLGDAVVLVLADTPENARRAACLVEVDYEVLPAVLDAKKALEPGAPAIYEGGNLLQHFFFENGDVEQVFARAPVVVEGDFTTPYQEHGYLETEAGLAAPTAEGGVEIWCPAQYCYRDRRQLTKILALPEEQIIIHSSPLGGAFGGKDDMALQPLLAIAALKLGRPVKITVSREESFLFSTKRLPFSFEAKAACDEAGKLLAYRLTALSEAGPYTGISGAVFGYAMENACGAYHIPNVRIEGDCVFTNRANTGAFRGFGNNQTNFVIETLLEQMAVRLGMDRMEIRRKNVTKNGERLSYRHKQSLCVGADATLQALEHSRLWQNREAFKNAAGAPHLKRGVGIATSQHGNGLGNALPDDSDAKITLEESGGFTVYVSCEEMGQGSLTALRQIAAEALEADYDQVHLVCGNSRLAPDTGSATASRVTYMAGSAILAATQKLHNIVAKALGIEPEANTFGPAGVLVEGQRLPWAQVAARLGAEQRSVIGSCSMPQTDVSLSCGLHYVHSHVSQASGVEVNTLTGEVRLLEVEIIPSAGTVVNPLGYEGQAEGGVVMTMGYTLLEDYRLDAGGFPQNRNLQTYLMPSVADTPNITVTPVELWEPTGPFGAKGLGEPVTIPGAPSITNAIHDAVGVWNHHLPASPERMLGLLNPAK